MSNNNLLGNWNSLLQENMIEGKSVAIGVFSLEENIVYANTAMKHFLNIDLKDQCPGNTFVNPEFDVFVNKEEDGLVFDGSLTIGNRFDVSYSLDSKVYRLGGEILVFAEANLLQLFEENKTMSTLNQQVNNLQRELIKEKRNLQRTLSELKDTQQMLVQSEKMNAMGQLVAGVAHEINNPIGFVYSNLFSWKGIGEDLVNAYLDLEQLIKNQENEKLLREAKKVREENDLDYQIEDMADVFEESKTGLDRVKKIVEDLRTFSRLDESAMKKINLTENLQSTISIAKTKFNEKAANFNFECPDELYVECYPGQLNQAILNVLINATQAIDYAGRIEMSLMELEEIVQISIKDDGCGIAENSKEKIFDPFYTTKPIGTGTGLGLSITHKIVCEVHQGKIEVESEPNKGTKFIISIPKVISL
ncbi:MAG: HAMP domain-containing histidine kinase [Labilibaculum sp.]|nr:ATP-binding protein [Labilibaculum sp.]MBI9058776.1 HAMP domain-containing histidine kinase [Labilibaculum sp.]